ncbi:MAG: GAF domain-containing protein [Coleofasciculaceae cyanobacterium SM2_1_6]|nr:GAF domain-containing protein [Coleofasciculaceae cyanobacterium SM2_1_6]
MPMQTAPALNNAILLEGLASEVVFTQDATGRYLSFYWQEAEKYGLFPEQIQGQLMVNTFSPIALDSYRERIRLVLSRQLPKRCQYEFGYQEQKFLFDLVIAPILGIDGSTDKVLVMGRQVPYLTNVAGQEAEMLLGQDPYYKLLTKIAKKIRSTLDLDTIWHQTVNSLGEALGVDRCLIYTYDRETKKLQVQAEYVQEPFRSVIGQRMNLTEHEYLHQSLLRREPVVMEQISLDTPDTFDQQSEMLVATCYQNEPNGLISLQQCDRRRLWSVAEIDLVADLADQVGTAIAHATLYKDLQEAIVQAEEASRLKSQFLANTSHELRTPLNGIIGFLKLVLEGMADDPEEQSEFIQEAHKSAIHLLNLINDILDLAKIEAGKMELDLSPVRLEELMRDLEDFIKNQAEQKNLSFIIETPPTRDSIVVYGNYQRLLQILLNLAGNAIKFTHEGGVTVSAEIQRKKVKFHNQEFPGTVKVQVADTGIGVSLDKQDRLFQSFSQVDGSRTRQYGGTGLGLAISQRLIEAMGGVVNFYSMGEGLGSTVTFTVPLYQEPVMVSTPEES